MKQILGNKVSIDCRQRCASSISYSIIIIIIILVIMVHLSVPVLKLYFLLKRIIL